VVDIRATLNGTDANDLAARTDNDATQITVVNPSGLYISATRVDPTTAPNSPSPGIVNVNSAQLFKIEVDVTNTGEQVDSVQVSLAQTQSSGIVQEPTGVPSVKIDPDSTFTFVFDINADALPPPVPTRQVIFTSSITKAISVNSGLPVTPGTASDNQEVVNVERPVNLTVALDITAPAAATDGTVSTNQVFTVTGLVSNLGVAGIQPGGEVTFAVPAGFTVTSGPSSPVAFALGSPMVWNVQAPAAAAAPQDLTLNMTTVPRSPLRSARL